VDACDVAKPAIADEDTWETASSVELGLEATRSGAPEGDTSGGVGNDVAASKGMLATISALVGAASSDLGDGVTVGKGLGTSDVAKAAKTDAGASETASTLEPGFESWVSMAIEGDAAASGGSEGVTMGRDVDACGVAEPATTGAGVSEPASLFEPDFGSMDLAASEGDTASSGVGDGVTAGKDVGASGVARAAKTDAGASETASPLEPGCESWVSMAGEGEAAASAVGEGVSVGRDMDVCGVVKPAITGERASDATPPGKAPERGTMTAFGDPVASTISA
jgi:hypothetical protein